MYQFDFLRTKKISTIISKIKPYDYVSFDIFDTLLKRDVVKPIDVFGIIGEKIKDKNFSQLRITAEEKVRNESGKEEVTLDDIYQELGKEYWPCKQIELETEKNLLTINPSIYGVYKYCKKTGKKIIVTSDMYLPPDFLKGVLHSKGIYFDYCFISCEKGKKKDTGHLFECLLENVRIKSSQVIHIGDSIRGDYLGAHKAGIKAILIPKIINQTILIDLKDPNQQKMFDSFINNHIDMAQDFYFQFGYAYFGPVLYGFSKWLNNIAKTRKIFFFARDGYLVKKVYERLYPSVNDDYIYLSRRALSVPLLWKHSAWGECFQYITMTRYFTIRAFIERLGLDPIKYEKQVCNVGLTLDYTISEKNIKNDESVHSLYETIKEDIIVNSKNEFEAAKTYFREKGFDGDIVVVDIGWNGSMQRYLNELTRLMGLNVKMTGCYFGIRKKIKDSEVHGYLYEPDKFELEPKLSFMQGLFECLFLAHDGSTKKYTVKNNLAEPVLYAPEYPKDSPEALAFDSVQESAIRFCEEYNRSSVSKNYKFSAKEYAYNLLRFGTSPSLKEITWFGDFRFFDTNIVYLAKPQNMVYYVTHPKSLLRDFSLAVWKAGFLKRVFKVKLPYLKIYSMMKG